MGPMESRKMSKENWKQYERNPFWGAKGLSVHLLRFFLPSYISVGSAKQGIEKTPKCTHLKCNKAWRPTLCQAGKRLASDDDEEEEGRVQGGYNFGEFYNFWNGSPPWGFKNWQTIAQSKGYKHLEENLQTSGFLMLQFTKSKCASSAPHLCSAGEVLEHM